MSVMRACKGRCAGPRYVLCKNACCVSASQLSGLLGFRPADHCSLITITDRCSLMTCQVHIR
jgi:hypothetical protein